MYVYDTNPKHQVAMIQTPTDAFHHQTLLFDFSKPTSQNPLTWGMAVCRLSLHKASIGAASVEHGFRLRLRKSSKSYDTHLS